METLPPEPITLVAGCDLFGQILVETEWGRIGTRGQKAVRSFATEPEACRYIAALLVRRRRAVRRIGVPYQPFA